MVDCTIRNNVSGAYPGVWINPRIPIDPGTGAPDPEGYVPLHAEFTRCRFLDNTAKFFCGAAIETNSATDFKAFKCEFRGNTADFGGAVCLRMPPWEPSEIEFLPLGHYSLLNSVFVNNSSQVRGSALHNGAWGVVNVKNCTFTGNHAGSGGTDPDQDGGAISQEVLMPSESYPDLVPLVIRNSILWNNTDEAHTGSFRQQIMIANAALGYPNVVSILNSDVQGIDDLPLPDEVVTSTDNIDENPLFDITGIRITPESPCLDAGMSAVAPWPTDIDENTRIVPNAVDMGINEVQAGACIDDGLCKDGVTAGDCEPYTCNLYRIFDSPSYTGCFADVNGDGYVNPVDRGHISANLGSTDPEAICLFDLNNDGEITKNDRDVVTANYGGCAPLPWFQDGTSSIVGGFIDPRFPAFTNELMCSEIVLGP